MSDYGFMSGDEINAKPVFNRKDFDPLTQQMLEIDGNVHAFEISRMTVETGKTFSSEAFDGFLQSIQQFVATRLVKHWEETGEPPTVMKVIVTTEVH